MKIEEYISDLLFEHDCVIVPDFGGFVCNYGPAAIDPAKHLFEPPAKRILFNKGLSRPLGPATPVIFFISRKAFVDAYFSRQ